MAIEAFAVIASNVACRRGKLYLHSKRCSVAKGSVHFAVSTLAKQRAHLQVLEWHCLRINGAYI